ncbi:UDP-N-acetylmuramoyl-L-alanyl-D-glutamate--2,6-diaminopimelate ligase [Lentisalinibacter orientalis]|uniref:UDP-N-acetylmuramoyl-L-alanyl-D-glutamate--2, 6-diaminopimelate ligase n=1 Tax=Lentisalinibacter orientalis TaxID=2992241 RepID=UPI00386E7930
MSAVAGVMSPPETPTRPTTLQALLAGIAPATAMPAGTAVTVSDITLDSRRVLPGGVFFALQGTAGHGLGYLPQALAAGAAAVVYEPAPGVAAPEGLAVPAIPVPGLRRRLGAIADRWFGAPSTRIAVSGATGTNGKTTVTWLLADALNRLERPCAYLGTLGAGMPDALETAALTTPDVIEVHRRLAAFAAAGAGHASIEVSSHALDQGRIDGVRLAAAAFTNLSRDHLDYHGSMAAYGEAKAKLLEVPGLERRVINADDAFGAELCRRHADSALAVTRRDATVARRRLALGDVRLGADGIAFSFTSPFGGGSVRSRLRGDFNVENLAVVLGLLLETGIPLDEATRALAAVEPPPGRLQVVGEGRPLVVVDYAHTPDALAAAIAALRPHCAGELWCVFGCGGERDPGKRPLMARAAAAAERVVVTSDNPRGEDPDAIIAEIMAGAPAGGATEGRFRVVADRRDAIAMAVREAAPADCVLVAGRGHERFQITASGPRPLSDAAEAHAALAGRSV